MNSDQILTYSNISVTLTKQITKTEKKTHGIYFTPPDTIMKNLIYLKPFFNNITSILEPSCGSGEYIRLLKEYHHKINITGIELNKTIFDQIQHLTQPNIALINDNFLTYQFKKKFDLIIGNPPYFVVKKSLVDKKYFNYFNGRPNIFILFIIKSLTLLNDNGILSFVLPKNFLNCLYYEKTRCYIYDNFSILQIMECQDNYLDTKQDTIILILQKKLTIINPHYSIDISGFTIFTTPEKKQILLNLVANTTTLDKLGFKVKVGNIVWNQCKKELTHDNQKTLLIYSNYITNNKIVIKKYSNKDKKNYINRPGMTKPILVVNRGYGVGKYHFNYCLINENKAIDRKGPVEYLIENHLICIEYGEDCHHDILIKHYQKIIDSFKNKKTQEFIKLYFGNNAINTIELAKVLPIY
jgi:type I restriction-modification system DNA methylase subunit